MNITAPKTPKASHSSASSSGKHTLGARKSPTGRGRGRVEHEVRPRARRASSDQHERLDVDSLYLADMAASRVLTAPQEVHIAERIIVAERSIIEALVSAPSGSRALSHLATQLGAGLVDLRAILLNPDQAGLDLERTRELVQGALDGAGSHEEALRSAAVRTLTGLRLDGELIERIVEAIREGGATSTADAGAAATIDLAREDLKRSKEELVVGNLRLVVLFARKYLGRGVALLDLVQEGNLGLMRAADKFDHQRGFRFSTYAAWWIKQALQRALLDRTLRLPVHVADDRRRVGKVRGAFVTQHRREPTGEEIAAILGVPRERVENILTLPMQPASLDTPVGEDGDATLGDLVPGTTELPDAAVALRALGVHLEKLMSALTPREQEVLRLRFGMGEAREHTLEEVGRALSLTRERIRQIERAALDKLRARESRVELRSYLEA